MNNLGLTFFLYIRSRAKNQDSIAFKLQIYAATDNVVQKEVLKLNMDPCQSYI